MNETEFTETLLKELRKALEGYEIKKGEVLIYKVIVNENGEFNPGDPQNPRRGNLSFQTDLLIRKNNLPLVVIEAKCGGFSTHDILTYSTKALKHKEVYPYLRYGLVVGNTKVITNKFFTHNAGFDFALALENMHNDKLYELVEIIEQQLRAAEFLLDILKHKNRTRLFNTNIQVENV